MSSHHIVKDNQEPALVVLSEDFDRETLFQLLEWSPFICVSGEAAEQISGLGIKVDALFFTEDHQIGILAEQSHLEYFKTEKNTQLNAIIGHLIYKGHSGANIIGYNSNELLANVALNNSTLRIVNYIADKKYFIIREPYKKWYRKDSRIHLHAEGRPFCIIKGGYSVSDQNEITCTEDGILEFIPSKALVLGEDI